MSNAEDLLEALIKALKDSNVDAEELRFMTLLPDHMRKIQDLTEEFVKLTLMVHNSLKFT